MARIRYSKGSGGDFELLPEGTFDFEITAVKQETNKKGNPQLTVDMEIVHPQELAGKRQRVWYVLVPQAQWRVDMLTEAAGINKFDTGEVDAQGEPIYEFEPDDLVGCHVQATISHREYEGKTRADLGKEAPSRFNTKAVAAEGAPAPAAAAPAGKPAPAAQPADGTPAGAPAIAGRRPRPNPSA